MRKLVTTALVTGVLVAGPLAGLAAAGPPIPPLPLTECQLAELLGRENVKQCEEETS